MQEEEDHQHHQQDREHQLELDVVDRGADAGRAIGEDRRVQPGRQAAQQIRKLLFDRIGGGDDVRARLALDIEDDRRGLVGERAEPAVLSALDDLGDILEPDRRAILIGDDELLIVLGGLELVVRVDLIGPARTVEAALGRIGVGIVDRGTDLGERQAVARQRLGIGADPHRGLLAAGEADQTDPADLADLLREAGVDDRLDLGQRDRLRGDRYRQDRRVGRVDLGIDRRRRQIGGQQRLRGVDRRLDLLLGDVEAFAEIELEGDHRRARRAGRFHPRQARHLAELPLERRADRLAHHLGAAARVERRHLDRRIVDLGQRGQRQKVEADQPRQHDRDHEQRGRDRPQDEQA